MCLTRVWCEQLKRKNKAGDLEEEGLIDAQVVKSVAEAHAKVCKLAWDGVLEFENLHKQYENQCVLSDQISCPVHSSASACSSCATETCGRVCLAQDV